VPDLGLDLLDETARDDRLVGSMFILLLTDRSDGVIYRMLERI
jgi:hypothetical protein